MVPCAAPWSKGVPQAVSCVPIGGDVDPHRHVFEDMKALRALEARFAGSDGERATLDAVKSRLGDDITSRVEGFGGHTAPWVVLGVHGVAVFLFGVLGFWYPGPGALGCLLATASLVGEGTGRLGLLRLWLPKAPSYNLVVVPEEADAIGTVVVTTPLDAPRVHLSRPSWMPRPLFGVFISSALLTALLVLRSLAEPWGTPLMALYLVCLGVTALTSAVVFATWRAPRDVTDDTGGMAAVMQVVRRLQAEPLQDVTVWTVFTGCGRAHQDGMRAFLSLRGERLKEPVLVLAVGNVGCPPLRGTVAEGPLWRQPHRPTGPALVERLRWAGVRIPQIDHAEASDARAATNMGYRAVSLVGGHGESDPAAAARAAEHVETLVRWYAEDLARVADSGSTPDSDRVTPLHEA